MALKQKHIVILGGGFAVVAAGIELRRQLNNLPIKITLIDKHDYHLFTPSLYEVATSEEPKKNIAIPFEKIFDKKFTFIKNTVENIDPNAQIIVLKGKETVSYETVSFPFNTIICAFGSIFSTVFLIKVNFLSKIFSKGIAIFFFGSSEVATS